MPLLKDEELSQVNGGVEIGIQGMKLVIDLSANPDLTIEQAYNDYSGMIQTLGPAAVSALNTVKQTVSDHPNVTKVEISIIGYTPTYYIGGVAYSQSQINSLPKKSIKDI